MRISCAVLLYAFATLLNAQAPPSHLEPQPSTKIQTGAIATRGSCSPVTVTSTGSITINCSTVGLSKEEIEKQGKQYAAILNSIRESGLKEDQILELVRQISQGMHQISEATKRRSLSQQDHDSLLKSLKQVGDTNLLIFVTPGDDNGVYAEDYSSLFTKDLAWKSAHVLYGLIDKNSPGVYFLVSKEDNDAHTVPEGCVLAGQSLRDLHLIDDVLALNKGHDLAPSMGTCTLFISRRKLSPQE